MYKVIKKIYVNVCADQNALEVSNLIQLGTCKKKIN